MSLEILIQENTQTLVNLTNSVQALTKLLHANANPNTLNPTTARVFADQPACESRADTPSPATTADATSKTLTETPTPTPTPKPTPMTEPYTKDEAIEAAKNIAEHLKTTPATPEPVQLSQNVSYADLSRTITEVASKITSAPILALYAELNIANAKDLRPDQYADVQARVLELAA